MEKFELVAKVSSNPSPSSSSAPSGEAKVSAPSMPQGSMFCDVCGEYDHLSSQCTLLNVSYVENVDNAW